MNKAWILIAQLYKQKIRSRSFIVMVLLYVGVISAVIFWSEIKAIFSNDEALRIALVNKTKLELQELFISDEYILFIFPDKSLEELKQEVINEEVDAVVEITEENGNLQAIIATYIPLTLNDQTTVSSFIRYAGKIYAIEQLNLSARQAEQILNYEPLITMTNLNEEATSGKSAEQKQSGVWVSYFVGIIIYFFLSTFFSMITTDVASEKGSHTLEMLLVSVNPSTHFKAKLVGVFLLALTQFAIIFALLYVLLRFTDGGGKWGVIETVLADLSPFYGFYTIVFLFLTIILYLIIGTLFGSLVAKAEEAGQMMNIAIIITLVGFYVMISGMANPNTIIIKVFSYVPLTSGMVMPMRIGATDIAAIEPNLSLMVLVLTVIMMYFMSLSFYKRSVLTYSSGGVLQKIKSVFKYTS